MVLQRSKLSVRRTVMMLTIRSRNRDNGARRGRVDCTHVVALSVPASMRNRFMDGGYYRYWSAEERDFSFLFFFFLAVGENIAKENGSRRGRFLSPYGYTHLKDA